MNDAPMPWVEVHASWRRVALVIAGAALAACGYAILTDLSVFLRSYLLAWLFVLSISLGSMAVLMMYHLTGGAWAMPVRRYFEAAVAQMPLLALLFIPIALGLSHTFGWVLPADAAGQAVASAKRWYLNEPFFLARAGIYLLAWIALAVLLEGAARRHRRLPGLSAAGLLIYGVTVTFAAVDWIGSLVPGWSSTALGMIVMTGQGLGAFAFAVSCAAGMHLALRRLRTPVTSHAPHGPAALTAERGNDLGNLLLAFVMTWMYLVFVQFLIIWGEDLPRETSWYLMRNQGLWRVLTLALVLGQFALPFGLLLFRAVKRNPLALWMVALLALAAHWLDLAWLVLPSATPAAGALHWSDFAASLGIGSVWMYALWRHLARRPSFMHAGFDASPGIESTEAKRHG